MTTGSFGHVDMAWEDPGIVLFVSVTVTISASNCRNGNLPP
jgi:hypothetical protein